MVHSTLWRGLAAILFLLANAQLSLAQEAPIHFGKVEAQDFAATSDTAAVAEVLCDYGKSRVEGARDGFQVIFERTTRLRILRKAGYAWATVEVPLYQRGTDEERLMYLKGFTYNLVDGKVVADKLASEAVFRKKVDEHHVQCSFTLPNVREGSIVEFSYTVKSDFLFNFQDWQFQHSIPVRWSEYRVVIPLFFVFKETTRGYLPFAIKESKEVPYATSYSESATGPYGIGSIGTDRTARITTLARSARWVMKDVPAFVEEPFMTTPHDYLASLNFELSGMQFPNEKFRDIAGTWEKITEDLLKDEQFGGALSAKSPLAAEAAGLIARFPKPTERLTAALALVQEHVRYNGQNRLHTTMPLRRVVEQHSGNVAEINLLLLQTLRAADLAADPVLLSTRSHGFIQTEVPVLNQFNYVVVLVKLPDQPEMLVDATEPLAPAGMLPERCLNGQGRLLATPGRWVPLITPNNTYLRYTMGQLQVTEQGGLQGIVKLEQSGLRRAVGPGGGAT